MITTSTSALDFTEKKLNETTENQSPFSIIDENEGPSLNAINAILNYSLNLEVKASKFVQHIEFVKS